MTGGFHVEPIAQKEWRVGLKDVQQDQESAGRKVKTSISKGKEGPTVIK